EWAAGAPGPGAAVAVHAAELLDGEGNRRVRLGARRAGVDGVGDAAAAVDGALLHRGELGAGQRVEYRLLLGQQRRDVILGLAHLPGELRDALLGALLLLLHSGELGG